MKLFSSISPELLKSSLIRGTLLAVLGAGIILFSGLFIEVEVLESWGFPLWVLGVGCIAFGLIPYRFLLLLSTKPNQIEIDENDHFHYHSRGKLKLSLPIKSIHSVAYTNRGKRYGIQASTEKRDYFFPYFSERSYLRLNSLLSESEC